MKRNAMLWVPTAVVALSLVAFRYMYMSAAFERRLLLSGSPGEQT
jgi:hypothetical protein